MYMDFTYIKLAFPYKARFTPFKQSVVQGATVMSRAVGEVRSSGSSRSIEKVQCVSDLYTERRVKQSLTKLNPPLNFEPPLNGPMCVRVNVVHVCARKHKIDYQFRQLKGPLIKLLTSTISEYFFACNAEPDKICAMLVPI